MKREIDNYVSDILKRKRHEKGWTQQQLSDYTGGYITKSFLNSLENINSTDHLNVHHINLFAEVFDCSPRDFLPEKPIPILDKI
jgi:transcriptional regulator with XRE-family HTH domain